MAFIHKPTLTWPLSERQIRQRHPNTAFPTPFVAPDEYAPIFETPAPAYNAMTQAVRRILPIEVEGQWFQEWEVIEDANARRAASAAVSEQNIAAARAKRITDLRVQQQREIDAEDYTAAFKTQALIHTLEGEKT
jgi:hypothetical protein